ncbi:hypothetical protein Metvu_0689 [Methanocaldococcus vulcanius M7]|uniref:Uncharacterized protein n=1 Tax=Methanocaldococcus vulcanius (strain ATCC 700851 / DSM 12094 / M7) TaxID=579137 RepID=C9RG45_METVM|nr:hypothetical protein Metvu_0689 [Methanocaldococcus vulcanius M7]
MNNHIIKYILIGWLITFLFYLPRLLALLFFWQGSFNPYWIILIILLMSFVKSIVYFGIIALFLLLFKKLLKLDIKNIYKKIVISFIPLSIVGLTIFIIRIINYSFIPQITPYRMVFEQLFILFGLIYCYYLLGKNINTDVKNFKISYLLCGVLFIIMWIIFPFPF